MKNNCMSQRKQRKQFVKQSDNFLRPLESLLLKSGGRIKTELLIWKAALIEKAAFNNRQDALIVGKIIWTIIIIAFLLNWSDQSVGVKVVSLITRKSHCCRPPAVSQTPAERSSRDASAVLTERPPSEPAQTSCTAQPLNMPHPQLLGCANVTANVQHTAIRCAGVVDVLILNLINEIVFSEWSSTSVGGTVATLNKLQWEPTSLKLMFCS